MGILGENLAWFLLAQNPFHIHGAPPYKPLFMRKGKSALGSSTWIYVMGTGWICHTPLQGTLAPEGKEVPDRNKPYPSMSPEMGQKWATKRGDKGEMVVCPARRSDATLVAQFLVKMCPKWVKMALHHLRPGGHTIIRSTCWSGGTDHTRTRGHLSPWMRQ